MTSRSPLLADLLRADESIATSAPDTLRTIAKDDPQRAPAVVDALGVLLETSPDQFETKQSHPFQGGDIFDDERDCDEEPPTAEERSALIGIESDRHYIKYDHSAAESHRESAGWALSELAPRHPELVAETIDTVLALLDSDTISTREYGLHAAGRIAAVTSADTNRVAKRIRPSLQSGTTGEQALGAWAMADMAATDPAALPPVQAELLPLLAHDHRYVRGNAAEAFCLVARENAATEPIVGSDFNIGTAVENEEFASVCAWAIARVSPSVSVDPVVETADHIEAALRGHDVLDALVENLRSLTEDPEPEIRIAAAVALVYLGSCADEVSDIAMPHLNALSKDNSATVASTVTELIQSGPFHPNFGDASPEIDPSARATELRVTPSSRTDDGGNRAYPGPDGDGLRIDGYNTYGSFGAAVRIDGPGGSTLVNMCGPSEDVDGVELNQFLIDHIQADTGESVTVQPAQLSVAQEVVVRPPAGAQFEYCCDVASAIKAQLATVHATPVLPGDVVPLEAIVDPVAMIEDEDRLTCNATVPVKIHSTTPSEPVLITQDSVITVAEDEVADFGDWWGTTDAYTDSTVELRPITDLSFDDYR